MDGPSISIFDCLGLIFKLDYRETNRRPQSIGGLRPLWRPGPVW